MTRQEARDYINNRLPSELRKAKKKITGYDSYICPFCGNGSGEDGSGICTKDGKHYTCFKGCFSNSDYLDILKRQHGKTSENDIFAIYNLKISNQKDVKVEPNNRRLETQQQSNEDLPLQFAYYFSTNNKNIKQAEEYLSSRGISIETATRFFLGYNPEYRYPRAPLNVPSSPAIIIPTSPTSFQVRLTDPNADVSYQKQKVGISSLFNRKALKSTTDSFIFIVEGEFDALSVVEVGGQAISLGGINNTDKLVTAVKETKSIATIVLSLDNDDAGKTAQADLFKRLISLDVKCIESNISGAYNDPNDALVNDRVGFTKRVKDPFVETHSISSSLDAFIQTVQGAVKTVAIPTGFSHLDSTLDGGFYQGLYVIGAMSGIGKSTLCLQIADQILSYGSDVIIFSLEMAKNQLISKSLSRLTFMSENGKNEEGFYYARTSRQITTGAIINEKEKEVFHDALHTYRDLSRNLYIIDDAENIGIETIKDTVKKHIDITSKCPVVIIDYLQILPPANQKVNDKQSIDNAVTELKRISMLHNIPVLAVSSFNRDSYQTPASMSSFKESGAIEYSSDVLLGLQLKDMDKLISSTGKKRENNKVLEGGQQLDYRELELKILKNRNGASGASINYSFYPQFSYFEESNKSESTGRIRI